MGIAVLAIVTSSENNNRGNKQLFPIRDHDLKIVYQLLVHQYLWSFLFGIIIIISVFYMEIRSSVAMFGRWWRNTMYQLTVHMKAVLNCIVQYIKKKKKNL